MSLTEQVPGEVYRQDDGDGEDTDNNHEDQDVPLEREVDSGIYPAFTLNLFISETNQKGNAWVHVEALYSIQERKQHRQQGTLDLQH